MVARITEDVVHLPLTIWIPKPMKDKLKEYVKRLPSSSMSEVLRASLGDYLDKAEKLLKEVQ